MKQILPFIVLALLVSPMLQAQKEYRLVRKGNTAMEKEKYNDAEIFYRKALEKNPGSVPARYNLGNALYKEHNYQEAASTWNGLISRADINADKASGILYNTGNAQVQAKNYQAAIEAYKQALKLNPADEDARYNLSYALLKARQQQQQQKQNQQQDQKQNQQQQQSQQNQQPQNQQQNQQPQQAQPQELSKQDAERMLEAMKNAEQKTMEKLKQEKKPMVSGRPVKDW
ncbi:MAG: tetratricopeptide repeat protein [Bacteroidales bacterium]